MLSASLSNLEIIPFASPKILSIIQEIKDFLETGPEDGRYELHGKSVYVMLVTASTEAAERRRPEFHDDYLDVQILLEGEEIIGYGHLPHDGIEEDLLKEKDLAFTKDIAQEKAVHLLPQDFAVFYPGELHRPLCASEAGEMSIRKAVLKIHRSVV